MRKFIVNGIQFLLKPTDQTTNLIEDGSSFQWNHTDTKGWLSYYYLTELSDRNAVVGDTVYDKVYNRFYNVSEVNGETLTVFFTRNEIVWGYIENVAKSNYIVVEKTTDPNLFIRKDQETIPYPMMEEEEIRKFCFNLKCQIEKSTKLTYTQKELEDKVTEMIEKYNKGRFQGEVGLLRTWVEKNI